MPILPPEPGLFPEDLFTQETDTNSIWNWWCLHTKPRREKEAARHLRQKEIAHFLPQVDRVSRTPGGRKIRSVVPLFPSYLFLRGDDRQRVEAMRSNHFVRVLEVGDQDSLEQDLLQIHRLLSSNCPIIPEPTYPVGSRVRIISGPLVGMVGLIVRRSQSDRFTAIVQFLGQGASIDLGDWQVELIEMP